MFGLVASDPVISRLVTRLAADCDHGNGRRQGQVARRRTGRRGRARGARARRDRCGGRRPRHRRAGSIRASGMAAGSTTAGTEQDPAGDHRSARPARCQAPGLLHRTPHVRPSLLETASESFWVRTACQSPRVPGRGRGSAGAGHPNRLARSECCATAAQAGEQPGRPVCTAPRLGHDDAGEWQRLHVGDPPSPRALRGPSVRIWPIVVRLPSGV